MDRDETTMVRRLLLGGVAGMMGLGLMPSALAKLPAGGVKGLIASPGNGHGSASPFRRNTQQGNLLTPRCTAIGRTLGHCEPLQKSWLKS